ncbi:MAG: TetR/AcrR family transcriptional regulator [Paludibacter sp.]|jgi:AcrR family transcriptional regulator|nr:TetR/AcrR family transcriptional regulator [Paludibacter sp.]
MVEEKINQPTEQAILEAAEKLFLEKGFEATSTTQIAKEVGCNQALIHYYFRTKDNLFNTIFEQKFRLFFQQLFNIEGVKSMGFEDKIRHLISSHFALLEHNPQIPLLIIRELSRKPEQVALLREKLRELPEKLFAALNDDLQAEIKAGRVRPVSLIDIMIPAISMNVALFVMMPVVEQVMQMDEEQKKNMIEYRRNANVDFILHSIRA